MYNVKYDTKYHIKNTKIIESVFRERTHTISSLNTFATVAVKIEMKSSDTTDVPRVKNLRVLALAL